MSFDEVRLPENVERGASGGPSFNTTVLELSSGHEQRNQNWAATRAFYDIGYGIQNKNDLSAVIAFFYARRGKARGFRFKDWSDFEVSTAQEVATGDDVTDDFQIIKRYDSGSVIFDRPLTKLVSGTVAIYIDDVLQTSGYSIDYDTGILSFTAAPVLDEIITWTGEFDTPVRFDTDSLAVSMEIFYAGTIPSIPLVEVRV